MVDQRRFDDQRFIESRAAAKLLGISLRTLYAYVSRGSVRSVPGVRGRPRLYSVDDLDRLRVRRDARAGHGATAAGALRWGEPVLDSAITAITPRGPAYRGHLAVDLVADLVRFENVAELLWSGTLVREPIEWPRASVQVSRVIKLAEGASPLDRMALVIALAGLDDPSRSDPRADVLLARGRRLIPLLAACLAPDAATMTRALGARTVAGVAARALGSDSGETSINVALVLLADHELNASSFAARVAASTGADPYACCAAALATLSGPKHGRAAEEIAAYADRIGAPDRRLARNAVRSLKRRGTALPAFGHPLYPAGDPRARPLLLLSESSASRRARTLQAIAEASDLPPSVDVALAALVAALGAPAEAASGLFAVARAAGWLAHAAEQRAAGVILRPRARYIGPPVIAR